MTEISKTSHGLKGLMAPDTVSTEVDIHQDGVTMVKSLCYFCHANCGVLAYVKDQAVLLTGLVNSQVIRTAEMMDMICTTVCAVRTASS